MPKRAPTARRSRRPCTSKTQKLVGSTPATNGKSEAELRRLRYQTVSKRDYAWLSGRPVKVINEQARRYGIPCDGVRVAHRAVQVDLQAVLTAFHDFLAENKHVLKTGNNGKARMASSPALEEYRVEQVEIARMKKLEMARQLVPREPIRAMHERLSSILRDLGDNLQRRCGNDAFALLKTAMERYEATVKECLGDLRSLP